ncbi:MAG: PIG-L family deacetylase [Acidimicrobiales bacterium]|jgi:LmbE family N-acetylglucosaminyl deacetylase
MSTVVFLHAHPDDEAIATAGTMAGLAADGHRVVLVTATGGELGEVPEGLLAEGETLAARRAVELGEAARILGVARHEFLGYLDSGMEGEPANTRPGCFAMADVDEAADRLAAILEDEAADVVVAYDEHGGYGHPDHVQVHRVGLRAGELAGTPGIFMATMDRDYLQSLRALADDSSWAPSEEMAAGMETMGEPGSRISTEVDVTRWIDAKRQAMRAHASQIGETSFFLSMPDEVFVEVWGREWYIRSRPPVPDPFEGPRQTGLLG